MDLLNYVNSIALTRPQRALELLQRIEPSNGAESARWLDLALILALTLKKTSEAKRLALTLLSKSRTDLEFRNGLRPHWSRLAPLVLNLLPPLVAGDVQLIAVTGDDAKLLTDGLKEAWPLATVEVVSESLALPPPDLVVATSNDALARFGVARRFIVVDTKNPPPNWNVEFHKSGETKEPLPLSTTNYKLDPKPTAAVNVEAKTTTTGVINAIGTVFQNLEGLKQELIDYRGSRRNMASVFFSGAPSQSDDMAVLSGLGHWPENATTMVGKLGLDNIEMVLDAAMRQNVEGDVLEAGSWRGGTAIFMRRFLDLHQTQHKTQPPKKLFVCDSFAGMPPPQKDRFATVSVETSDTHHLKNQYLAVSLETVQQNFRRFGCSIDDGSVVFLKGWFKDTLGDARIGKLAVLRADGDMYSSTMDILSQLYDKVVPNGYLIIDDYGLDCCRSAVHKFFADRGIDVARHVLMASHSIAMLRKSDLLTTAPKS
jgi:hypothetical protein